MAPAVFETGLLYLLTYGRLSSFGHVIIGCWQIEEVITHNWFRPAVKSLDASMEIGFQVTISKSEVQITSNLFPLNLNRKHCQVEV